MPVGPPKTGRSWWRGLTECGPLENVINGELYISIDTVKENAIEYGQDFPDELHRVIIHGALHLCGLDDHSEEDIKEMREAENSALELLATLL